MKKLQRFLSAILCVVMIAAMVLPMSAAGEASVKELLESFDKDAYTVVEFGKDGKATLAEYQGGSGVLAEHTVYDGVNATKLVAQDIAWATFAKSHIAFANNLNEFKEYGYMVVKYASESDKAYKLTVGGWGDGTGATFDVSAGKTGWTTSEVLEISPACVAVSATKRSITSSYSAAATYIGNIVFFKNEADAQEYAKMAPYYLDPNGEAALAKLQQREENWETIKFIMMLIGSSIGRRQDAKPYEAPLPLSGIDTDLYYILDCSNDGNISIMDFAADGVYAGSYATYNGVDGVKLGAQKVWAAYAKSNVSIVPLSFLKSNNYSCMVFRYASDADNEYELGFGWGSFYEGASFAVPAGKTDWTLSDVLNIPDALIAHGASRLAIASTSPTADTYIADIIFFQTRTAAKQYVDQWNEYYAGAYNPIPNRFDGCEGGYTLHTLVEKNFGDGRYGYDENTFTNNGGTEAPNGIAAKYTTYLGVECIQPVYNYSWANVNGSTAGGYGVALHNLYENNTANRKYGVITYASTAEHQLVFNITWARNGVIGSYPDTDGWMSTCFEIEPGSGMRESDRPNTGVYSTDPFYLREIVFFETKEDAEAYAAKAPAYFNGEEFDEDDVSPVHPANMRATEIYARISTSERKVPTEGNVYYTLDANAAALDKQVYFNDYVEYLSGFGTPPSHAAIGAKKGVGIRLYGLKDVIAKTDDAYMVAIIRSESASSQNIGMKPVAYDDNVNLGTIPANTKGWVATTPVNIKDIKTSGGLALYDRLIVFDKGEGVDGSYFHCGREFGLYTDATDTHTFDVCEIAFFTSKAAADEYSAKAVKYYNDLACLDSIENISQNGEGRMSVLTFDSELRYTLHGDKTGVTHVQYPRSGNSIDCVKVEYGASNWYNSTYRFAFTGYPITSDYKYAVVTFASESENKVPLYMKHWNNIDLDTVNNKWITTEGAPTDTLLCDDISISNGKWVTTGVIGVTPEWVYRTTTGQITFYLGTKPATDTESLYIRSIAYFTSMKDAEAYIKVVPEYYNGEPNTDPAYWLDVLGAGYVTTFEKLGTDWLTSIDVANKADDTPAYGDATYKNVACMKFETADTDKRDYPPSSSIRTYISFRDNYLGYASVLSSTSPYKYMIVTYATETATTAYLKMNTWGTPSTAVFTTNISASGGNWVASDIIEITLPMATATGNKLVFFSDLTEEDEPIYVREIKFFTNREAAEYYQTNAPAYYNSFN